MARLAAGVAAGFVGLTALNGNVADVTTPVTFHFIAHLLDVAKAPTAVAFLLIEVLTVAGHVARLATGVAAHLSLLLGLCAVPGDVAAPVAVVARILRLPTILGNVTLVPTPEAEVVLATSPASATSTAAANATDPKGAWSAATATWSSSSVTSTSEGAVLDPMPGTVTAETLVDGLLHYLESEEDMCHDTALLLTRNPSL